MRIEIYHASVPPKEDNHLKFKFFLASKFEDRPLSPLSNRAPINLATSPVRATAFGLDESERPTSGQTIALFLTSIDTPRVADDTSRLADGIGEVNS